MINPMQALGNLGDMQKLKSMHDAMKKQVVTLEKQGVKITVSGDLTIKNIEIDGVTEHRVANVINDALKEIQQKMASNLMQMK